MTRNHSAADDTGHSRSTGTRRAALQGALGLGAGLMVRSVSAAAPGALTAVPNLRAPSFHARHEPVPLPFDPASLKGLSARLVESHWANNYGGSVRALNEINLRLASALSEKDLPAYVYNDLKREHLVRTGSVVLHELYFENLGGSGPAPAHLRALIERSFGDFKRWETEFRRMAAGLGGGSGWVVLGFNHHLGILENYWMADHMHGPVSTRPLLVMDMYEHAYHMDFGAAAARYVDAFFANINWQVVFRRSGETG